ncbi:hypothetical protein FKM82_022283 [Ascaphus truei]
MGSFMHSSHSRTLLTRGFLSSSLVILQIQTLSGTAPQPAINCLQGNSPTVPRLSCVDLLLFPAAMILGQSRAVGIALQTLPQLQGLTQRATMPLRHVV